MKCILDGSSVKVLARAIHALAKIGDELHIEPIEQGLTIKTVNASKSAYSVFNFHLPFFLDYSFSTDSTDEPSTSENTITKCKLPMKSILSVFRSIGSLDKSVETCSIELPPVNALLIIEFRCKHGIAKHFNLRFFECESVEAEFSRDGYASKFSCTSRFYSEALMSFHSSTPEVTWSLEMDQVHLMNHIDDELDASKCVRTDVKLAKDEFIEFNVVLCTKITFCLKELRAVLGFAESLGLDIHCRMENAGQPVLFSLNKDDLYSADFLLATLTPAAESTQSSSISKTYVSRTNSLSNATPVLRNQSKSRSSRSSLPNTSMAVAAHTPDQTCRLNSLSLLEPQIYPQMEIDYEAELNPPPTKRARARYIFQRCLKPSQDDVQRTTEVYAPPSDSEED